MLKNQLVFLLIPIFFISCTSLQEMNYYDETVQFIEDTDIHNCSMKINNQFWIDEIDQSRSKAERLYLDSIRDWDFDDVVEYGDTLTFLKIHSNQLDIDYKKVLEDLKISDNRKLKIIDECEFKKEIINSIPVFNKNKDKAIIEREGRTFIYRKNDAGKWIFDKSGIVIIH